MSVDPTEIQESFLTVAEVAEVLKLNQQTVRNWIDQGSLPALRVGRRVRIRRSDFDRVLAEGYSGGGRAAAGDATASISADHAHDSADGSAVASPVTASAAGEPGPNADDFWGGEPVGRAEPSQ